MHAHSFPALAAMWFGMMTVMMAPTAWPWVAAFNRLSPGPGRTPVFIGGYAAAWLLYSLTAASIQLLIPHAVSSDDPSGSSTLISAAILFTAGAFQFAPIKRACLMHCRNPLTYFLSRWRDGSAGSFGMGFHHGLFCVACCWALMATALAVGVMSLWWMAALSIATFAEQVFPWGERARQITGFGLIAGSFIMALW